ncbi:hypothetical protein YC2023_117300 [Brassica napus]
MIHDSLQFATATMKLKWNWRLKHQSTLNLENRRSLEHRSTEPWKHPSTFITEQSQTQEQKMLQILVILEELSLVFSEIRKDKHVPLMDELYTSLETSHILL